MSMIKLLGVLVQRELKQIAHYLFSEETLLPNLIFSYRNTNQNSPFVRSRAGKNSKNPKVLIAI